MRVVALALLVSVAATARASGPELAEQSPAGVALAGAQAADVGTAAAVYYNPALLAFTPGLMIQGGGAAVIARATATAGSGGSDGSGAFGVPSVFVSQRLAARYAVGLGVYAPFAWTRAWPASFAAGLQGLGFDWRAVAVNPSVAIRPRGWVALGLGVDIVPTTITLRRAVIDGNVDGTRRIDVAGTGIGGNAGLLFHALPRRLDVGVAYRSAMRINLAGSARTTAPPQATGDLPPSASASATLPTPHVFTVALAARPITGLTVTVDLRVTLWQELSSLSFTLVDAGRPSLTDATLLEWRDTVGVRVGVQYGLWRDGDGVAHLTLRLGGGYEQSPAGAGVMSPLVADGDRGLVAAGLAARWGAFSVEVGYSAAIATPHGGYGEVTHVVAAALTARWSDFLYHVNEPAFAH